MVQLESKNYFWPHFILVNDLYRAFKMEYNEFGEERVTRIQKKGCVLNPQVLCHCVIPQQLTLVINNP